MEAKVNMKKTAVRFLFISCAILGLYGISRWNFLFLHALVETAAIGISWVIATIVWNARARIQNQFILICGLSFAVVGALEMLHLYSVVGMNVFPVNTPDLEAQFWVSARLIQGSALLGGLMA